ncbi:MAG: histone, partial [Actinomycetota bacterium]|nr:histone [Actinomycetota bacterium]
KAAAKKAPAKQAAAKKAPAKKAAASTQRRRSA